MPGILGKMAQNVAKKAQADTNEKLEAGQITQEQAEQQTAANLEAFVIGAAREQRKKDEGLIGGLKQTGAVAAGTLVGYVTGGPAGAVSGFTSAAASESAKAKERTQKLIQDVGFLDKIVNSVGTFVGKVMPTVEKVSTTAQTVAQAVSLVRQPTVTPKNETAAQSAVFGGPVTVEEGNVIRLAGAGTDSAPLTGAQNASFTVSTGSEKTPWWVWASLAASGLGLIVVLIVSLGKRRR